MTSDLGLYIEAQACRSRVSRAFLKMGGSSWPSESELDKMRKIVAEMGGGSLKDVRIVVSPYRICPLGAHIDHQGGTVSAMTINKGILLGFILSGDPQVLLQSGQFQGEVRFSKQRHCTDELSEMVDYRGYGRVDEVQHPQGIIGTNKIAAAKDSLKIHECCDWGNYARGALYALQRGGYNLTQGIIGYICGSEGLDSSGLSSSAAAGVAYLLALENANNLSISPTENIELDRLIENEYLGIRNGILDQSAILLSSYGCLTCMNCKTKEYMLIELPKLHGDQESKGQEPYKILLALSGLKHSLRNNPGYNSRVSECQEAARVLLCASGNENSESLLCNVEPDTHEAHKNKLELNLAKRAEHYFSENMRVTEGLKAWATGRLEDFGRLISASGSSSIQNYECGCEPLIQLYEILLRAPGVFGARFSGAGFRGCCVAFVDANHAVEAASFVRNEYGKLQPELASKLNQDMAVLICEAGDSAHVID